MSTIGIWPFESPRWRMFYAWRVGRYLPRPSETGPSTDRPWVSLVKLHKATGPVSMTDDEARTFASEEEKRTPHVSDAVSDRVVSKYVWNGSQWIYDGRAGSRVESPSVRWNGAMPTGTWLPRGVEYAPNRVSGEEIGRGGGRGRGGGGRGGRGGRGPRGGHRHRHHHGHGWGWGPGWYGGGPWWGCPPWDPDCEEEAPVLDARRISGAQDPIMGARALSPALRGKWPSTDLPLTITVHGRPFRKAEWAWPYPGVRAQYRETNPQGSMHLFVLEDGTWIVPHIDEENPDLGNPLTHLAKDILLRRELPPV